MAYCKEKLIQLLSFWGYRVYHPDTFAQVSAATEFSDQLVFIGTKSDHFRRPVHIVVAHLYCASDQLVLTVFPHHHDGEQFEKLAKLLTDILAPCSHLPSNIAYHREIDPHWKP